MASPIPFENIDARAPVAKRPPLVCIGPRGQIAEMPGNPEDAAHMGGDLIGKWHEGTFSIAARHRMCAWDVDDEGERYPVGWSTYEEMCMDPRVLARHKLTIGDSRKYLTRHMALVKLRDAGNDVHNAVARQPGGWGAFYHPEIMRRRGIPQEFGRVVSPDELAALIGGPKETAPVDSPSEPAAWSEAMRGEDTAPILTSQPPPGGARRGR